MNAAATPSFSTRLAAFVVALLASGVVLGSTVAGMQPREDGARQHVIALERVTVTAARVN